MIKQTKEQVQKLVKHEKTAGLHLNQTNQPKITKQKRTAHQIHFGLNKIGPQLIEGDTSSNSDISLLDQFFVDALGGLISVVGENIEIDIRCLAVKPFQEMKFYKTYGDMWNCQSEKEQKIQFPQLISGTRKDYVFELRLPKISKIDDYQRTVSILEATIKTKNSVTGQLVQKYFKLDLSFYNQNEQIVNNVEDFDVSAQYMRVKGTEVIDDARRACNQGQFKEAEQMIDKMIQLVQSKSQLSSLPVSEILFDLSQAKQASNQRSYRTYGQSQMIQMTQNNYQQQGLNSNFDEFGRQIPHAGKSSTQNYYSEALVRKIQKSKQQYQTVQYY